MLPAEWNPITNTRFFVKQGMGGGLSVRNDSCGPIHIALFRNGLLDYANHLGVGGTKDWNNIGLFWFDLYIRVATSCPEFAARESVMPMDCVRRVDQYDCETWLCGDKFYANRKRWRVFGGQCRQRNSLGNGTVPCTSIDVEPVGLYKWLPMETLW